MLDQLDVKILQALSENPGGSGEELRGRVGLSTSGLLKRLRSLVERGILNKESVRAQVSYSSVGLEPVIVFAESKPSQWERAERACDAHPYTQFRIRCMGAVNGFLFIFAIPANTRAQLLEFLNALRDAGAISSFAVHYPISKPGHSETQFELFNAQSGSWNVNWGDVEAAIDGAPSELTSSTQSVIHKLDQTDIEILRLLSIDSRAARKSIAQKVGIPDYEISRRLRSYSDWELIEFHRVVHETGVLGMLMTVVMKCKAPFDYTGKIVNAASKLPFQGNIYPVEDGFILVANVPPSELTKLVNLMQKMCSEVELTWADYTSSMKYFFDNDPSNFGKKGWVSDRTYTIDDPLRSLTAAITPAVQAS